MDDQTSGNVQAGQNQDPGPAEAAAVKAAAIAGDVAGKIGPAESPDPSVLDESQINRVGGPPAAELNRREFASGVDRRGIDELERDGAISKGEAAELRRIKAADSQSAVGVAGWAEGALGAPRPPSIGAFRDRSGRNVLGMPQLTKTPATVGRVLHMFRKKGDTFEGPLCAHVVKVWGPDCVNVCVLPDGCGGPVLLEVCSSVRIYDPIPDANRQNALEVLPSWWAEWMPYQAGQAQRTQQSEGVLAKQVGRLEGALRKLADHLKNDGSGIDTVIHEHLGG